MVLGRAENPDSGGTASYCLGPDDFFFFAILDPIAQSGLQGLAPCYTNVCWGKWTFQCDSTKNVHPEVSASRSDFHSSHDHTRPLRLSVALAMVTMNARRFQKTHLLRRMESSLNPSYGIGTGVTDVADVMNLSQ